MSFLHIESLLYGKPFRNRSAQPKYEFGKQTLLEFQISRKNTKSPTFDFRHMKLNKLLAHDYELANSWEEFMNILLKIIMYYINLCFHGIYRLFPKYLMVANYH